jgi:hypothetical protein
MALVMDAATRNEVNDLKLKLRALGVDLDAIKWSLEAVYWDPMGFDFMAADWRRVQHAADVSSKLGQDSTDMPGYDAWRKGAVVSVGYTRSASRSTSISTSRSTGPACVTFTPAAMAPRWSATRVWRSRLRLLTPTIQGFAKSCAR